MSDVVRGYGEMRRAVVHGGRHAVNEEAVLTPIFHALRHSGWRGRQTEPPARRRPEVRSPDAVDEFRRDPLTAPIPVQAFDAAAAPSPVLPARAPRRRRSADTGAHALMEPREGGRHHFRLETAGSH